MGVFAELFSDLEEKRSAFMRPVLTEQSKAWPVIELWIQTIWKMPEELRRELADLGSRSPCALHEHMSSKEYRL
jgi:hypothetical protein